MAFAVLFCISARLGAQEIFLDTASLRVRGAGNAPAVAEYKAPTEYHKWMLEVAKCAGLDTLPAKAIVQFFAVNGTSFRTDRSDWDMGVTLAVGDSLQTFIGSPHTGRQDIVKHELMHLLLYTNGKVTTQAERHPAEYFRTCGQHISLPDNGKSDIALTK